MRGNAKEIEHCRVELGELLKLAENRYCADCGVKQPTWASTNIGVFVCIRCSGIHRNLGTHISKVKSTTLDSWTFKLLQNFKAQGGNIAVNLRYESRLARQDKPTESTDNYKLEQFIRTKYCAKKWFDNSTSRLDSSKKQTKEPEKNKEGRTNKSASELRSSRRKNKEKETPAKPPTTKKPVNVPDLLPPELLPSKKEPDELLTFANNQNGSQVKPLGDFGEIWNTQSNKPSVTNATSAFVFLNAGNNGAVHNNNNRNNGNNIGIGIEDILIAKSENKETKSVKKEDCNQGFDFIDEPTVTSPKASILAMYKQQPMLQRMDPTSSSAFMTQLPPNLNPLSNNASTNMRPIGTQPQMPPGHMAAGFNDTSSSDRTHNPYTMLNNQPGQAFF